MDMQVKIMDVQEEITKTLFFHLF